MSSEPLLPLSPEVEISNLVAKGNQLGVSRDGGQVKEIQDDAAVDDGLREISVGECTVDEVVVMFDLIKVVIDSCVQVKWDIVGVILISEGVPRQAVAEGVDDGCIVGAGAENGVIRSIKGEGSGGFFIEQLVALVREAVVDASQGEFTCGNGVGYGEADARGIGGDAVVLGGGDFFVLWEEVKIVLEPCARYFGVIGCVI